MESFVIIDNPTFDQVFENILFEDGKLKECKVIDNTTFKLNDSSYMSEGALEKIMSQCKSISNATDKDLRKWDARDKKAVEQWTHDNPRLGGGKPKITNPVTGKSISACGPAAKKLLAQHKSGQIKLTRAIVKAITSATAK